MINYLKGTIDSKKENYIIIDVNSIGYKVFMPENSVKDLSIGSIQKIYTYLRVSEDEINLYGFLSYEELAMFELLISVGGIGSKSAIKILSNIVPSKFALAVISNDINILKKLPGIGPKTAQRIILELKDKLKKEQEISIQETEEKSELQDVISNDEKISEAVSALQVLGYSRKEISDSLKDVDTSLSIEDIIRKGLANLSRGIWI